MANIVNGRYALADPSSGLTMLSLEGGELNMFGSYTRIRTTHKESYPVIHDEPTELAVKNSIIGQLITGLAIAAVLAGVAIAVAVTGGMALAPLACALGGAAIGVGAVAIGTAINDSETGYNRSWGEYWGGLITGGCIGFMAGASVYGIIAAVPAAATAAGVQASMMLGTSTFTAIVVPNIMTVGGYSLAAASGLYAANDIYSNSRGYNVVLDKIFDNNVEAYETAGMVLDMFGEAYTSLGESNQALGHKSNNASEEQGAETSKKFVNSGDNDNVGTELGKDNNIKNTVNTEIGTAEDNSIKNSVKSDDIAIETTQGDNTKSIVNNKGAESADGDIPHIEIKDKNSKQGVPETDAQGDIKVQECSYNRDDVADNKGNNKSPVNLDKGEDNTSDKSIKVGNGKNEKDTERTSHENEGVYIEDGKVTRKLPQGISQKAFEQGAKLIKNRVGNISDDIVVQGSRASGTAKSTSDIDIAIRVTSEKFDELIKERFKVPNPGSAKERTMLHAIETGKIQAGEAGLRGLRKELEQIFGMEVDISIIKKGGAFDNPPFIPINN